MTEHIYLHSRLRVRSSSPRDAIIREVWRGPDPKWLNTIKAKLDEHGMIVEAWSETARR
jgi:hypothetical protein